MKRSTFGREVPRKKAHINQILIGKTEYIKRRWFLGSISDRSTNVIHETIGREIVKISAQHRSILNKVMAPKAM